MIDPSCSRAALGWFYLRALAGAYLRYRNPRRRRSGRHHAAFYERAWREAAAQLGASCSPLGGGITEIRLDGACTRVVENTCPIDDPVTLAVLSDKALTHRVLAREGLAVPHFAEFDLRTIGKATAFLEAAGRDVVVKPAGGSGGGRGVTTGIRRRSHLARAAATAAVYADDLLVEEQVDGDNYRLLYLDGELIDTFVRRAPTVVGDGRSSVARLVRRANDDRLRSGAGLSQVLLTVDPDVRRTLAKQGLSLRSVPLAGASVTVKTVVNENCGFDNTTATHVLCDSIIEDGAKAVRALRVRLAGIDVITRDPSVPLAKSGGVILEVNAPPNYYYHYQKSDASFPVAVHVLERLLLNRPSPARSTFDVAGAFPGEVHRP
jgi:cyanophycin synthetase